MKLCWEATGGTPGSCVRGPIICDVVLEHLETTPTEDTIVE